MYCEYWKGLMSFIMFEYYYLFLYYFGVTSSCNYPSLCYGYIIPGSHETPTDSDTIDYLISQNLTVEQWELNHVDMIYGGSGFNNLNKHTNIQRIGYMYTQKIDFDATDGSIALRRISENNNIEYESLFLHFTSDTTYNLINNQHSIWTSLYGYPFAVGWTQNDQHSGFLLWQKQPWNEYNFQPWQDWNNNGTVFVFHSEPFTCIKLIISNTHTTSNITHYTKGILEIEYPNLVNTSTKQILNWHKTDIIIDETDNLSNFNDTQNFKIIKWKYPKDWQRAATYNPILKSGKYFGKTVLLNGEAMFVIKLKWKPLNESIHLSAKGPYLHNLLLDTWITFNTTSNTAMIPGWDHNNDLDNDGYVNDTEYINRINYNASARFKFESRVIPIGKMWSQTSSWCRINTFTNDSGFVWKQYLYEQWETYGLAGAYNDDMVKLVGPENFNIIDGGYIYEYDNVSIQSNDMVIPYTNGWVDNILSTLRGDDDTYIIAGNVGAINMFVSTQPWRPYLRVLNTLLREEYMTCSVGMTGYFGIAKAWDTFVFAQRSIKSLIQINIKHCRVSVYGNTKQNWELDITTSLAIFYLMNVKDLTYLNIWGNGYVYGSGNTKDWNYYKSGVPMNIAYSPYNILAHDIGYPIVNINNYTQYIKYQVKTETPLSDYTVIGDSTSNQLFHSELSDDGYLDIIPSYIYYVWYDEPFSSAINSPNDMVLARKYSNGLILYRTNIWSGQSSYFNENINNTIEVQLNDTYRVINYDGSLGDIVISVILMPYQGIVLKKHIETTTTTPITTATYDSDTSYVYETTVEVTRSDTQQSAQTEFQSDDNNGKKLILSTIFFNIFMMSYSFL